VYYATVRKEYEKYPDSTNVNKVAETQANETTKQG
jgi:hypothetical protein